jgi:hypothetical protein
VEGPEKRVITCFHEKAGQRWIDNWKPPAASTKIGQKYEDVVMEVLSRKTQGGRKSQPWVCEI